ncbi:MAG: endonuclease MutS2, partial [Armatimonadota bacterium]
METDERTLENLEYPKVKELLAGQTACSLGRERALRLSPTNDPDVVAESLRQVTEARAAVAEHGPFPFGGLTDVSALLERARIGATLEGEELNRIADALRAIRRVRAYLVAAADECPSLQEFAGQLGDYAELERAIRQSLDDEGDVVDGASPELARLRRHIQAARSRVLSRLDEMLSTPTMQRFLQDRLTTIRSGRYCVPVKSQFQRE